MIRRFTSLADLAEYRHFLQIFRNRVKKPALSAQTCLCQYIKGMDELLPPQDPQSLIFSHTLVSKSSFPCRMQYTANKANQSEGHTIPTQQYYFGSKAMVLMYLVIMCSFSLFEILHFFTFTVTETLRSVIEEFVFYFFLP